MNTRKKEYKKWLGKIFFFCTVKFSKNNEKLGVYKKSLPELKFGYGTAIAYINYK
ncbi:hypothetical protein D348_00899 [Enterococcus faecalis SLO2C-1]|nr:hypothetical protein D348_00899 [Enterococcus faecalis SLO2C-1]